MDFCSAGASYYEVSLQSPTSQIRLLQLNPGNNSEEGGDPVDGILLCTELKDAPQYEALSYHWGRESTRKRIKLNGQDIEVQENLESALRHLRRSSQPRMLWVDRLCINQDDVHERNAQVAIMHEIYQNASRTVAWIGDGQDDGEFAIEFLRWYAGRKLLMHPADVDGHHPDYEAQGWSAVRKFLQRPYWRRLWVMQEIALSSEPPFIACGRARLGWGNLTAAIEDEPSAHYARCLHRVRGATIKLIHNGMGNNPKRMGRHVIFLLSSSAGFGTTEPRDRVYALYGLLKVVGIVGFTPDYSISVAEVYQRLTDFALTRKAGLDVLELRPHDQDPSLPSWVVDLSKRPPLSFTEGIEVDWQRPATEDVEEVYADRTRSYYPPSSDAQILRVTGAVIDRVATVGPIPTCVANVFRDAAEWPGIQVFGGNSIHSDSPETSKYWAQKEDASHPNILCRHTIEFLSQWQSIISYFCDNRTRDNSWSPRTWDWKQMKRDAPACPLQNSLYTDSLKSSGGKVLDKDDSQFETKYREALNPLLSSLSIMMQGRTCFETDTGLHGVSLIGTQKGDEIVACQSTKRLHVVRPSSSKPDQHVYVGAAIVCASPHEVNGNQRLNEIFRKIRDNEISDTTFVLH